MRLKIRRPPTPIILFALLLLSIVMADMTSTLFISRMLHPRLAVIELTDSLFVAVFAFPMLYFFMYRPLILQTTERKKAEEVASQLFSAIEQADEAVAITSPDRVIEYANPAFEQISGYTRQEAVGSDIRTLISGQVDGSQPSGIQEALRNALSWRGDLVCKRKDGSFFDAFTSISPVKNETGEVLKYVSIIRDISQRKQTEIALREAKEQADDAVKIKDKFVTLVVHDLRGPFNSIIGFLQILMKDRETPLADKQRDLVERVLTSSGTMVAMIDEILSLSRLQTGTIRLKRKYFDLPALVDSVTEHLLFLIEKKGIILRNLIPPGTEIFADYHLLKEVVQNLVSNAIKFTPTGGTISIFTPSGTTNIIAIQDTGVGISANVLPRLFRADEKTSSPGTMGERGSGFGLPLSYEIVRAHGGDLYAESEEGKGSTFYVNIHAARPSILFYGVDEATRQSIKRVLQSMEIDFLEAEEQQKAAIMVKHTPPALVIADISISSKTVMELLKQMKDNLATKDIPVMLIIPPDSPVEKAMAFKAQANDFISKPISANDLTLRVRRFIFQIV